MLLPILHSFFILGCVWALNGQSTNIQKGGIGAIQISLKGKSYAGEYFSSLRINSIHSRLSVPAPLLESQWYQHGLVSHSWGKRSVLGIGFAFQQNEIYSFHKTPQTNLKLRTLLDDLIGHSSVSTEYRIFQQYQINHTLFQLENRQRIRLEERFFSNHTNALRIRWKWQIRKQLFKSKVIGFMDNETAVLLLGSGIGPINENWTQGGIEFAVNKNYRMQSIISYLITPQKKHSSQATCFIQFIISRV